MNRDIILCRCRASLLCFTKGVDGFLQVPEGKKRDAVRRARGEALLDGLGFVRPSVRARMRLYGL